MCKAGGNPGSPPAPTDGSAAIPYCADWPPLCTAGVQYRDPQGTTNEFNYVDCAVIPTTCDENPAEGSVDADGNTIPDTYYRPTESANDGVTINTETGLVDCVKIPFC